MLRSPIRTALAAAAATALLAAGGAYAVDVALDPATSAVTLSKPFQIKAGETNPTDFPGLKGDKPGEPLPKGYVAVGYKVTVTQGSDFLHPSFTMRCPAGRGLYTFATEGKVTAQIVGPNPFVRRARYDYQGKRSWAVIVDYNRRELREGQTISGTVYGLCR